MRSRLALTLMAMLGLLGARPAAGAKWAAGPTAGSSTGSVWYVAPDGSDDNPGSIAAPWRTLAHALPALGPGDVLELRGGAYVEDVNTVVNPGSPSNGVLVTNHAGERPVVQGKLWVQGASYWTFSGVNVTWGSDLTGSDQMVRVIRSHDWRWTNSELWGAHSTAAMGLNPGTWAFRVDHNYIHDTYPSNETNQDHLIYVDTDDLGPGATGVIERNILANSPNGRGIKNGHGSLASTPPTGGLTIRYNTFVNNLGPANIQLSYGASDDLIYRNIFVGVRSGYANVARYTGIGTGNVASDNIGWDSAGVLDVGPGLTDGGGNRVLDPELASGADFRPSNPLAQDYGRYAPGDAP